MLVNFSSLLFPRSISLAESLRLSREKSIPLTSLLWFFSLLRPSYALRCGPSRCPYPNQEGLLTWIGLSPRWYCKFVLILCGLPPHWHHSVWSKLLKERASVSSLKSNFCCHPLFLLPLLASNWLAKPSPLFFRVLFELTFNPSTLSCFVPLFPRAPNLVLFFLSLPPQKFFPRCLFKISPFGICTMWVSAYFRPKTLNALARNLFFGLFSNALFAAVGPFFQMSFYRSVLLITRANSHLPSAVLSPVPFFPQTTQEATPRWSSEHRTLLSEGFPSSRGCK